MHTSIKANESRLKIGDCKNGKETPFNPTPQYKKTKIVSKVKKPLQCFYKITFSQITEI
uniref:Uncharacterized protein n=1 Tax=Rhizophora mucronata TaxID=61149 RepID=A0A2P2QA19_RHIMU